MSYHLTKIKWVSVVKVVTPLWYEFSHELLQILF